MNLVSTRGTHKRQCKRTSSGTISQASGLYSTRTMVPHNTAKPENTAPKKRATGKPVPWRRVKRFHLRIARIQHVVSIQPRKYLQQHHRSLRYRLKPLEPDTVIVVNNIKGIQWSQYWCIAFERLPLPSPADSRRVLAKIMTPRTLLRGLLVESWGFRERGCLSAQSSQFHEIIMPCDELQLRVDGLY